MSNMIDVNILRSLAGGDTALMREVLCIFTDQAASWRSFALSAGMEDTDNELSDLCHTIRGSASGIGAVPLAEACAHLEKALADGRSEVRSLIGEVCDMLARTTLEAGHLAGASLAASLTASLTDGDG